MQLITASNIASDDVVIAISHSGMSRTVNAAVKAAHEAGAFTIGITQSVKSTMTQYCNLIFYNATSDITVGKEIVAHRFSENACNRRFSCVLQTDDSENRSQTNDITCEIQGSITSADSFKVW